MRVATDTYILIRFVFRAHIALWLAFGGRSICSALLFQPSLQIFDFGLQNGDLVLVSIESSLTVLALHMINHILNLLAPKKQEVSFEIEINNLTYRIGGLLPYNRQHERFKNVIDLLHEPCFIGFSSFGA